MPRTKNTTPRHLCTEYHPFRKHYTIARMQTSNAHYTPLPAIPPPASTSSLHPLLTIPELPSHPLTPALSPSIDRLIYKMKKWEPVHTYPKFNSDAENSLLRYFFRHVGNEKREAFACAYFQTQEQAPSIWINNIPTRNG